MLQAVIDWISKNKEIAVAMITVFGGMVSGWLLKGEKDKWQRGYDAAKSKGYEDGQRQHAQKLDRLEDRVTRCEQNLTGHIDDLREIFARLSDAEREASRTIQNIADCQTSRDGTFKGFRELLCVKISEMEKRLLHQLTELRQQAKKEKEEEAREMRAWIREEVERLLG